MEYALFKQFEEVCRVGNVTDPVNKRHWDAAGR